MSEAEAGLAEFSGTRRTCRRSKGGRHSGKILEQDARDRQWRERKCCVSPGLADCLGNTIEQLLGEAGYRPAKTAPGPAAECQYRRSTLDNVGLYGQMAGMDPTMSGRQGATRMVRPARERRERVPNQRHGRAAAEQAWQAERRRRQRRSGRGIAAESELISSESRKSARSVGQEKSR